MVQEGLQPVKALDDDHRQRSCGPARLTVVGPLVTVRCATVRMAAVLATLAVASCASGPAVSNGGDRGPGRSRATASRRGAPRREPAPAQVRGRRDLGYPGQHPRGTHVPASAVIVRAGSFGLADCASYLGASYPVRRAPVGNWIIDGPELSRAAAQGTQDVEYLAASHRTLVAWGTSLVASSNSGATWWRSYLGGMVRTVHLNGEHIRALVFPNDPERVSHSRYLTWTYTSADGGRTWSYRGLGSAAPLGPIAEDGSTRHTCG